MLRLQPQFLCSKLQDKEGSKNVLRKAMEDIFLFTALINCIKKNTILGLTALKKHVNMPKVARFVTIA